MNSERAQMDSQMMAQQMSNNSSPLDVNDGPVDENIRGEILQLKQRLAGTDLELQRTNTTLRSVKNIDKNYQRCLDFAASFAFHCLVLK